MNLSRPLSRAIACAAALVAVSALPAQQQKAMNKIALEQYLDFEDAESPLLSPDGTQVIYTRR